MVVTLIQFFRPFGSHLALPQTTCMTIGKSFLLIPPGCDHLSATASVKCVFLSHRSAINTLLLQILSQKFIWLLLQRMQNTHLCFDFLSRLPHLTSPSTPQQMLGSFMTPRRTRSMPSRCSTSRSQSHHQQLSHRRRYFTLLCAAGILYTVAQDRVFCVSIKAPHMK